MFEQNSINNVIRVVAAAAMTIPRTFRRTLPFLKILAKSKPRVNKIELLRRFPDYVTNDIIEMLYNILVGNVRISSKQKSMLSKHRKAMHNFANLNSLSGRRQFIYKQKGGFITTILPMIISALGSLFRE